MKKTIVLVAVGISVALLIFGSIFYEFCKDVEKCGTEYCLYKMLFDTIKAIGTLLFIGLSILYWYFLGEKTDSFLKKQKKWISYLCLAIFAIIWLAMLRGGVVLNDYYNKEVNFFLFLKKLDYQYMNRF